VELTGSRLEILLDFDWVTYSVTLLAVTKAKRWELRSVIPLAKV